MFGLRSAIKAPRASRSSARHLQQPVSNVEASTPGRHASTATTASAVESARQSQDAQAGLGLMARTTSARLAQASNEGALGSLTATYASGGV